jgi:cytochrome P450
MGAGVPGDTGDIARMAPKPHRAQMGPQHAPEQTASATDRESNQETGAVADQGESATGLPQHRRRTGASQAMTPLACVVRNSRRIGPFLRGAGLALDAVKTALISHMLNSDPPDHTRLRKLVVKAFTPRRVESLRPRIEEITAGLLDGMAGQSEVDLLGSLAFPLPIQTICELPGVDEEVRDDFRAWSNTLHNSSAPDEAGAAAASMAAYLPELTERKRQRATDDLLSALIEASEDEDRLSEHELISMAFLLLAAGHETTVTLIGNCVLALLRDPAQFAALREDPELVSGAIEEALRFDGPVNVAILRYTTEAVRIGEVEIPADEVVFVSLSSANRDADRFAEPDQFDLRKDNSGHLAFGHGIRYCIGASLPAWRGRSPSGA